LFFFFQKDRTPSFLLTEPTFGHNGIWYKKSLGLSGCHNGRILDSFFFFFWTLDGEPELPWGEEEDLHEVVEKQLREEGGAGAAEEFYEEDYFDSDTEDAGGEGLKGECGRLQNYSGVPIED